VPIYEYEPDGRDCYMCDGKLELLQNIHDEAYKYCPYCGLDIKKLVSKASFAIDKPSDFDHAASKGFTTYRKAEKGVWEKVGGEGADYMIGSEKDKQIIEEEKQKPARVLDLDKPD
jgi:putative FmdB family regulatory protein